MQVWLRHVSKGCDALRTLASQRDFVLRQIARSSCRHRAPAWWRTSTTLTDGTICTCLLLLAPEHYHHPCILPLVPCRVTHQRRTIPSVQGRLAGTQTNRWTPDQGVRAHVCLAPLESDGRCCYLLHNTIHHSSQVEQDGGSATRRPTSETVFDFARSRIHHQPPTDPLAATICEGTRAIKSSERKQTPQDFWHCYRSLRRPASFALRDIQTIANVQTGRRRRDLGG